MLDTEQSEQKRAWKVELIDMFRGEDQNFDYLFDKFTTVMRSSGYLEDVTDEEMNGLISLAVQHNHQQLFDTDAVEQVEKKRRQTHRRRTKYANGAKGTEDSRMLRSIQSTIAIDRSTYTLP